MLLVNSNDEDLPLKSESFNGLRRTLPKPVSPSPSENAFNQVNATYYSLDRDFCIDSRDYPLPIPVWCHCHDHRGPVQVEANHGHQCDLGTAHTARDLCNLCQSGHHGL